LSESRLPESSERCCRRRSPNNAGWRGEVLSGSDERHRIRSPPGSGRRSAGKLTRADAAPLGRIRQQAPAVNMLIGDPGWVRNAARLRLSPKGPTADPTCLAGMAPMHLSISPCSCDLGRKRLSRHRRRYPTVEPGEGRLSSFRIYLHPLVAA
jgi:hypothetical protein